MVNKLDEGVLIQHMDVRPVALSGRQIVFGLDRVTLELEIIEHSDGELECGISVAGVNVDNVEEIGNMLEERGINVI